MESGPHSTVTDVSFGLDNQIPFTNNASTNFDYSSKLTWNDSSLYVGGNLLIDGSAYIGSTIITNYQYNGNPTTNGSWRSFISPDASADLVFEKRVSGVWVEKQRFV